MEVRIHLQRIFIGSENAAIPKGRNANAFFQISPHSFLGSYPSLEVKKCPFWCLSDIIRTITDRLLTASGRLGALTDRLMAHRITSHRVLGNEAWKQPLSGALRSSWFQRAWTPPESLGASAAKADGSGTTLKKPAIAAIESRLRVPNLPQFACIYLLMRSGLWGHGPHTPESPSGRYRI